MVIVYSLGLLMLMQKEPIGKNANKLIRKYYL